MESKRGPLSNAYVICSGYLGLVSPARFAVVGAAQNRLCHHKTRTPVKLPELPYAYEALEPVISRDIMKLHHQKHHQAYVNGLNDALQKLDAAQEKGCVKTIISLEPALRFHGGGHLNHSIFWKNLCPGGSKRPAPLQQAIERDFKSFDAFKKRLSEAATALQGSGWAWLGYSKATERLEVRTCINQDPLEATTGLIPLLGKSASSEVTQV